MFSPKDKETRKPRGFTFCQYRRKEDADDAVKGMDKRVGSLDCMNVVLRTCCLAIFLFECLPSCCTVDSVCVFVCVRDVPPRGVMLAQLVKFHLFIAVQSALTAHAGEATLALMLRLSRHPQYFATLA